MRLNKRVIVLGSVILAALLMSTPSHVQAYGFSDQFADLQRWTIYRGEQNKSKLIDNSIGMPAPSLYVPVARYPLNPDPPGFGDNVTSIYLSNPDTSVLSNFTVSFWIRFDHDAGRAMITFRMQDDRNYYAIRLSDTHDWNSEIMKFSDDKPIILAQVGPGVFVPKMWSYVEFSLKNGD